VLRALRSGRGVGANQFMRRVPRDRDLCLHAIAGGFGEVGL
jgi:hypothetical protein